MRVCNNSQNLGGHGGEVEAKEKWRFRKTPKGEVSLHLRNSQIRIHSNPKCAEVSPATSACMACPVENAVVEGLSDPEEGSITILGCPPTVSNLRTPDTILILIPILDSIEYRFASKSELHALESIESIYLIVAIRIFEIFYTPGAPIRGV